MPARRRPEEEAATGHDAAFSRIAELLVLVPQLQVGGLVRGERQPRHRAFHASQPRPSQGDVDAGAFLSVREPQWYARAAPVRVARGRESSNGFDAGRQTRLELGETRPRRVAGRTLVALPR